MIGDKFCHPHHLGLNATKPGHTYKMFLCSTQLNMKFQLLVKTKILTKEDGSCLKSLRCCIYHAYKC